MSSSASLTPPPSKSQTSPWRVPSQALSVPALQPVAGPSTTTTSSASTVKRRRSLETSNDPSSLCVSPKRAAKRVREATPVLEDSAVVGGELASNSVEPYGDGDGEQNASIPTYITATTVAESGESSSRVMTEAMDVKIEPTSEGEGGSVLFSEQAAMRVVEGGEGGEGGAGAEMESDVADEPTEPLNPYEVGEDESTAAKIEVEDGSGFFLTGDGEDDIDVTSAGQGMVAGVESEIGPSGLRITREPIMGDVTFDWVCHSPPPPTLTTQQAPQYPDFDWDADQPIQPCEAGPSTQPALGRMAVTHANEEADMMSRFMNAKPAAGGNKADGHDRHSETAPDVDVDEDIDADGDGYESSEGGSYHSGDSSDFEMDHRPVLERTAVKRDIRDFEDSMFLIRENGYKVIDRLGEGTFSSVYLARDIQHNNHDNSYWSKGKPVAVGDVSKERSDVKVAIKKILVTSSPARITNELQILESLRGCRNVSQLITAYRDYDQVVIVLPYHRSDDFRHFYRHMDPPHIKMYMLHLLQGLKDIHRRGIVHRDIKPANFLFDYESGTGVICDFGLAERYVPPRRATCQHAPATQQFLSGQKQKTPETAAVEQALYDARKRSRLGEGRVGFPQDDKRPSIKTNRAGTRGFRAPEVLLKCPDQTVAIDVWSAGIMLLSILTHKFPVFNSNDDVEALMEIAAIFGRDSMERCALLHNRTIISNVPTVDHAPESLTHLVLKLNPHLYTPQISQPTPQEAKKHITDVDNAIDLCSRLLRLDHTKRLTAAQSLRHAFFRTDPKDQGEQDIFVDIGEGKCGRLHAIDTDGKHKAVFEDRLVEMQFGMGLPPTNQDFCPEHEHYQQRTLWNPVVNARQWYGPGDDDGQPEEEEQEEDEEEHYVHADDLDLDVDGGE